MRISKERAAKSTLQVKIQYCIVRAETAACYTDSKVFQRISNPALTERVRLSRSRPGNPSFHESRPSTIRVLSKHMHKIMDESF